MIKLDTSKFVTHKKGETLADCQDAVEFNADRARYAIADGATRSFFPKMWAELLVKSFCEEVNLPLEMESWEEWIEPLRKKWLKQVVSTVQETKRFISVDRLSRSESAASTFVGLEIDKIKGEWKAMIIGDSCLFHIEESELKESHLIRKSDDFTNRPEIFASFARDSIYEPIVVTGKTKPGDIFILATDALAKWIIQYQEAGKLDNALEQLISIGEHRRQFKNFVEKAREAEDICLVNDDVAFLLICVKSDRQLPKLESSGQELGQQNLWFVFLVCLLAGGGMLVGLYLMFYFLLKLD